MKSSPTILLVAAAAAALFTRHSFAVELEPELSGEFRSRLEASDKRANPSLRDNAREMVPIADVGAKETTPVANQNGDSDLDLDLGDIVLLDRDSPSIMTQEARLSPRSAQDGIVHFLQDIVDSGPRPVARTFDNDLSSPGTSSDSLSSIAPRSTTSNLPWEGQRNEEINNYKQKSSWFCCSKRRKEPQTRVEGASHDETAALLRNRCEVPSV